MLEGGAGPVIQPRKRRGRPPKNKQDSANNGDASATQFLQAPSIDGPTQSDYTERTRTSVASSKKRKLRPGEREALMAEFSIFMTMVYDIKKESEDLYTKLLEVNHDNGPPPQFSGQSIDAILKVLADVRCRNEDMLKDDVTPWVVPSKARLGRNGGVPEDAFTRDINALWSSIATMGSTVPKPDFIYGLSRKAFSKSETDRLKSYDSPLTPVWFTSHLCFPYLIVEAKTGMDGLELANFQNVHSASLAVRAIIRLYQAAFGKTNPRLIEDLFNQILVFSVSHNNETVNIYGHVVRKATAFTYTGELTAENGSDRANIGMSISFQIWIYESS